MNRLDLGPSSEEPHSEERVTAETPRIKKLLNLADAMVGRLDRNLRKGHRAELEGIGLLRPFCAVAPVPQTDDVGFDAVATLLRTDGRFFYAEDSFCVQFKARSVREIDLKPHEYRWFHSLSMPLFIGSVDTGSKTIELFTTHWLAAHPNTKDFKSAILYLDPGHGSMEGDCMRIGLGPPVLRWTGDEGESSEFQALAYSVLKQWLTTEYVNLGLRRIRMKKQVWRWMPNEVPEPGMMTALGDPDELLQDLEAAVPYLTKIATHVFSGEESRDNHLGILGFYLFANWIHEQRVPDMKVLVQMMGQKLGVHSDKFSLQLNIEKTNAGEAQDDAPAES